MPRTTVDIDASILRELKGRAKSQRKSLGAVISEIVAPALTKKPRAPASFRWETASMRAKVDLEDDEAVRQAIEES